MKLIPSSHIGPSALTGWNVTTPVQRVLASLSIRLLPADTPLRELISQRRPTWKVFTQKPLWMIQDSGKGDARWAFGSAGSKWVPGSHMEFIIRCTGIRERDTQPQCQSSKRQSRPALAGPEAGTGPGAGGGGCRSLSLPCLAEVLLGSSLGLIFSQAFLARHPLPAGSAALLCPHSLPLCTL